jgi:hypothetical protein
MEGDNICTCYICEKQFSKKAYLKKHMNRHNNHVCKLCGKQFNSMSNLSRHKKRSHQEEAYKITCDFCALTFVNQDLKNDHDNKNHKNKCMFCNMIFYTPLERDAHIERLHPNVNKGASGSSRGDGAKDFKCKICDQKTKDLYTHFVAVHKILPEHICTYCNAIYKSEARKKKHIANMHTTVPSSLTSSNKCYICHESCLNKKALYNHLGIKHNLNVKKMCTYCNQVFASISVAKKHMENEHGTQNKPFCKSCGCTFSSKFNKLRHDRKFHLQKTHKNMQRLPCTQCDKNFTRAENLKRHIARYHDKQPLPCTSGPDGNEECSSSDIDNNKMYTLYKYYNVMSKKFGVKVNQYKCQFTDLAQGPNVLTKLLSTLTEILHEVLHEIPDDHVTQFSFLSSEGLDYPIVLPFLRKEKLNAQIVLDYIANVLQSYKSLELSSEITLRLLIVNNTKARGFSRKCAFKSWVNNNRVLLTSNHYTGSNCLFHAVILSIAYKMHQLYCKQKVKKMPTNIAHLKCKDLLWMRNAHIKLKKNGHTLDQITKEIKKICNIQNEEGYGLEHFGKIQNSFLKKLNYRLQVFNMRSAEGTVYTTEPLHINEPGENIYIYIKNNHAYSILRICAFLHILYFCPYCLKNISKRRGHTCTFVCFRCSNLGNVCTGVLRRCNQCQKYYQGEECMQRHIDNKICAQEFYCNACDTYIKRIKDKNTHLCGRKRCTICHTNYNMDTKHECFIQSLWIKDDDEKDYTYIVFDCESMHVRDFDKTSMIHEVFCICSTMICKLCIDAYPDTECVRCGKSKRVFFGKNAVTKFCNYAFRNRGRLTLIASHFGGNYDVILIQKYLYDNSIIPKIISKGNKIIMLSVPKYKIRCIDTIHFLPMPLACMKDSLNITTAEKKGFPPYMLWSYDNINEKYTQLPSQHYFNTRNMTKEKHTEFKTWYEKNKNKHYCMKKEVILYCQNDVAILTESMIKFKKIFMQTSSNICERVPNGINPFNSVTLPGACARVFRACFLFSGSLGIIPPKAHLESQSKKALMWMKIISHEKNVYIHHARNGKEIKIGRNIKLDGYYKESNGQEHLLQFAGCKYHGCPHCWDHNDICKLRNVKMGVLYDHQQQQNKEIKRLMSNAILTTIWECEYDKLIKQDNMKYLVKKFRISDPIDIRSSLRGGRCECYNMSTGTTGDEEIKHYDFRSMYPAVQYNNEYPLGQPIIYTENFKCLNNEAPFKYKGFIKCEIIPPSNLFLPVLPLQINKKLHFTLCYACSATNNNKKCTHSNTERSLTGVWSTFELQMAIAQNYSIEYVYEIWHWSKWSKNIFKGYVLNYYKYKVKASGFPSWCKSEQDKIEYVKKINEEGLQLSINDIEYNKGMRTIVKNSLVSSWGKFSELLTRTQVKYTSKMSIFQKLLSNNIDTISDIFIVSKDIIRIDYTPDIDNVPVKPLHNVAIGSLVTSYGRLHIYKELSILGKRCIYTDTDSTVFKINNKDDPILDLLTIGPHLGELADELSGDYITKFICLGPKCYAYRTQSGYQKLCAKGIPQTLTTADIVTIENMDAMVTKFVNGIADEISIVFPYKIYRDNKKGEIHTSPLVKKWKCVMDKRVLRITGSYTTYPYGFRFALE